MWIHRQLQNQANDGGGGGGAPWYGEIPAERTELREWVGNKAYATPIAALESAFNLEKLAGAPADQIIRLPKADDAAGWQQVWGRLGRPEKPEQYELPVPEGDDGAFAKVAAGLFHQAGVPKAAAQSIAKAVNEHAVTQRNAYVAQLEAESKQQLDALKAEWGNEYDQRTELAKRGLAAYGKKAGLDDADLGALESAIGTAKMLKMFVALGETTGEHDFGGGGGGGGGGGLSPAQAQTKLNELRQQRMENKITQEEFLKEADRLAPIAARAA